MLLDEIKKDILKNEGATLNNEFKKANLKSGFMVSIMGYEFITNNIDEAIKKGLEYKEIIKDKKGYYVGFWIDTQDNNKIYVDISKNISNKRDAEKTAKKNLQKGIYSLKDNKTIYLNYNVSYYSLYKIIRGKDEVIKDYKFIKQVDTIREIKSNYRNDKNNYIIFKDLININEL